MTAVPAIQPPIRKNAQSVIAGNQPNSSQLYTKSYTNLISGTTTSTTTSSTMWTTVTNSTPTNSTYLTTDSSSVSLNADAIVRDVLTHHGLILTDGGRLKLVGGVPEIEYAHADGKDIRSRHRGVIDLSPGIRDIVAGTVLRTPDGVCYKVNVDGTLDQETLINTRERVIDVAGGDLTLYESLAFCHFNEIHIPDGVSKQATLRLPDGAVVVINPDGSLTIDDSNAKRLYRTQATYAFNPYLNASDLLEEFILYCGKQKITKEGFRELPVSLFIYWLIVRAAEADGDPVDEMVPLLTTAVKQRKQHTHHCRHCGRYLPKRFEENGIHFCSPDHMRAHMATI